MRIWMESPPPDVLIGFLHFPQDPQLEVLHYAIYAEAGTRR